MRLRRHYPEAAQAKQPYRALLDGVIGRQARLVAQWMLLGFIHGVMNTDNTSISGETIDYGPCAFMEAYDPVKVYSSIDLNGRYAYGNQPHAALWNLARLAEALLPVLEQEQGSEEAALAAAHEALAAFAPQWQAAHQAGLGRKLGLFTEREGDAVMAQDLLDRMAANQADFTLTFRRLSAAAAGQEGDEECARVSLQTLPPTTCGLLQWRRRLERRARPEAGAGSRHAERESCVHSAQSSGGGGDQCRRRATGFPALRGTAGCRVAPLRGPARHGAVCDVCAARGARSSDLLRHVSCWVSA